MENLRQENFKVYNSHSVNISNHFNAYTME